MSERPYPNGVAWDEAWRQRQIAEQQAERIRELEDKLEECLLDGHGFRSRIRLLEEALQELYDFSEPSKHFRYESETKAAWDNVGVLLQEIHKNQQQQQEGGGE